MRLARAHGSRVEHMVPEGTPLQTVCGLDAKPMAKFRATERGQDAKVRPLCSRCSGRH